MPVVIPAFDAPAATKARVLCGANVVSDGNYAASSAITSSMLKRRLAASACRRAIAAAGRSTVTDTPAVLVTAGSVPTEHAGEVVEPAGERRSGRSKTPSAAQDNTAAQASADRSSRTEDQLAPAVKALSHLHSLGADARIRTGNRSITRSVSDADWSVCARKQRQIQCLHCHSCPPMADGHGLIHGQTVHSG